MDRRESLKAIVKNAEHILTLAQRDLAIFDAKAENNVFDTLDNAEYQLEDQMRDEASDACAGAGNMGCDEYTQRFMVGGIAYIATLTVEYNRHDKTYYYVDSTNFTYKLLGA